MYNANGRGQTAIFSMAGAAVLAAALSGCGGGGSDSSAQVVTPAATPASYSVGGSVSGLIGKGLELQLNGGASLAMAADGGFTFPAPLTEGSAYAVTVKTQPELPAQNCVTSGASGTVGSSAVTNVTVACGFFVPKFAFVANGTSNDVSAYTVDPSTGALANVVGAPFRVGLGPRSLATDPAGKFLYVPGYDDGSVSAFATNATTGVLTAIPGAPFTAFGSPRAIAIERSGKFAYVISQSGLINAYSINTGTGALSRLNGSPYSAGSNANYVALDPSGRFAYVSDFIGNQIWAFSIQAGTGALTPIAGSPFAATGPAALAADPLGKFLYATNVSAVSAGTVYHSVR
jgi:6-phosphogluconolactonase